MLGVNGEILNAVCRFLPNDIRGVSVFFGEDEVRRLCKKFGLDLIVRAHQVS